MYINHHISDIPTYFLPFSWKLFSQHLLKSSMKYGQQEFLLIAWGTKEGESQVFLSFICVYLWPIPIVAAFTPCCLFFIRQFLLPWPQIPIAFERMLHSIIWPHFVGHICINILLILPPPIPKSDMLL